MTLLCKRIILTFLETFIQADHLSHSLKHYLKGLDSQSFLADGIAEMRHSLWIKFLYLHIFPLHFPQQDEIELQKCDDRLVTLRIFSDFSFKLINVSCQTQSKDVSIDPPLGNLLLVHLFHYSSILVL